LKLLLQKHLLQDPAVDGRIIQQNIWISRSGMDWIDLAQDKDR